MNGFVKLHRKILEKPIWFNSTAEQRVIWVTLLLMASHKETEWDHNGEKFHIMPGQFITSLESIRENCHCSSITTMKIRTALVRFEKLGFLTCQTTNKYTLITIVNWRLYQCEDDEDNKQNNKRLTSTQQALNKHLTTIKNNKNIKNDKNIYNNTNVLFVPSADGTDRIVGAWNELEQYNIKPIKKITPGSTRERLLNARIRQYGTDDILNAIENVKHSKFLQGINKNGWQITFDWFIKPNNFIKVLEGNYNDTPAAKQNTSQFGVNL